MFIILNAFLLVYLGIYTGSNNISKEAISSTINILKKSGVEVSSTCKIPTYNKRTPMLMLENGKNFALTGDRTISNGDSGSNGSSGNSSNSGNSDDNGNKRNNSNNENNSNFKLHKNIEFSNMSSVEKYCRDYLNGLGIKTSNFILDKYIKNPDKTIALLFIEKYKGFFVFDNEISVNISKNGIINISQNIRKIKGFTTSPSIIMPAHQVLLKHFYNKKDITIKSIDIGFKGFDGGDDEQESKETFQGPAWRIVTNDGNVIFLKAYDGEVID